MFDYAAPPSHRGVSKSYEVSRKIPLKTLSSFTGPLLVEVHRSGSTPLEFFVGAGPGRKNRWRVFLRRLVEDGLCAEEKSRMLLEWPGIINPPQAIMDWPSFLIVESLKKDSNQFGVFARTLNHVKINLRPKQKPEVKACLGFGHIWVSPISG